MCPSVPKPTSLFKGLDWNESYPFTFIATSTDSDTLGKDVKGWTLLLFRRTEPRPDVRQIWDVNTIGARMIPRYHTRGH